MQHSSLKNELELEESWELFHAMLGKLQNNLNLLAWPEPLGYFRRIYEEAHYEGA